MTLPSNLGHISSLPLPPAVHTDFPVWSMISATFRAFVVKIPEFLQVLLSNPAACGRHAPSCSRPWILAVLCVPTGWSLFFFPRGCGISAQQGEEKTAPSQEGRG